MILFFRCVKNRNPAFRPSLSSVFTSAMYSGVAGPWFFAFFEMVSTSFTAMTVSFCSGIIGTSGSSNKSWSRLRFSDIRKLGNSSFVSIVSIRVCFPLSRDDSFSSESIEWLISESGVTGSRVPISLEVRGVVGFSSETISEVSIFSHMVVSGADGSVSGSCFSVPIPKHTSVRVICISIPDAFFNFIREIF